MLTVLNILGCSGDGASWLYSNHGEYVLLDEQQLTLNNPQDVFGFTDRPVRDSTWLTWEAFSAHWYIWADDFTADPPNAVIEGVRLDGSVCSMEIVIESEPTIYDDSNCASISNAALFIDS